MGIEKPIAAGGLFPPADTTPDQSPEDLDGLERWEANHPSFEWGCDAASSPGKALLEEHLNAGFGELFTDLSAAEAQLGGKLHPAPLGSISKTKEDGSVKHRLIQDQRRNGVNATCVIPERQVLPAF